MTPWLLSGVVSFGLGAFLRARDRRSPTGGEIDLKKLTPLQVVYSCLLTYPVCVLYVLVEHALP